MEVAVENVVHGVEREVIPPTVTLQMSQMKWSSNIKLSKHPQLITNIDHLINMTSLTIKANHSTRH